MADLHPDFLAGTEPENDQDVLLELTSVGTPVFRVWDADPRKDGEIYGYRIPIADEYADLIQHARRDPRITVIRNPRGLPRTWVEIRKPEWPD